MLITAANLFLALTLTGVSVTTATELETRQSPCQDVHVFLARGNNEPYPGRQGVLIEAICSDLDSCDYEDIQMNNALSVNYCTAVTEGARNGLSQITAYDKRCPNTKLVVSGYSQGGT